MRDIIVSVLAVCAIAIIILVAPPARHLSAAETGHTTAVYTEQGGNVHTIDSGGTEGIESGGTLNAKSGSTVTLNGATGIGGTVTLNSGAVTTHTTGSQDLCAIETTNTSPTISATHSGAVIVCSASDLTATLPPATPGLNYTVTQSVTGGSVGLTVAPSTGDELIGAAITTPTANKAIINTAASSKPGDSLRLVCVTAGFWQIVSSVGTWARQP